MVLTSPLFIRDCNSLLSLSVLVTDTEFVRYEKQGNLIGNEYFLHAYGPIYVLSAEIVASLAAARNGRFEMFLMYLTSRF